MAYPSFIEEDKFLALHDNLTEVELLRQFSKNLKTIHKLTTDHYSEFDTLIYDYLNAGVKIFNMEIGIVSDIREQDYFICDAISPDDSLKTGDKFELEGTYCREVVKAQKVLCFSNVGMMDELKDHPVYINMKLESYISAPIYKELDIDQFLNELNFNLPADIRAKSIKEVDDKFNIINDPKTKKYSYFFSYGQKNHPFAAPFMVNFKEELNIEIMKQGAALYIGEHNFKSFCYRPKEGTNFEREILSCEIVENDVFTANFFPEKSFVFNVESKGFMRHQVRLMIGTLISLGRGEISLEMIEKSLRGEIEGTIGFVAPSSGLMLLETNFS